MQSTPPQNYRVKSSTRPIIQGVTLSHHALDLYIPPTVIQCIAPPVDWPWDRSSWLPKPRLHTPLSLVFLAHPIMYLLHVILEWKALARLQSQECCPSLASLSASSLTPTPECPALTPSLNFLSALQNHPRCDPKSTDHPIATWLEKIVIVLPCQTCLVFPHAWSLHNDYKHIRLDNSGKKVSPWERAIFTLQSQCHSLYVSHQSNRYSYELLVTSLLEIFNTLVYGHSKATVQFEHS